MVQKNDDAAKSLNAEITSCLRKTQGALEIGQLAAAQTHLTEAQRLLYRRIAGKPAPQPRRLRSSGQSLDESGYGHGV